MPELAEVEYYRKQWLPALGQSVSAVHLNAGKRVFRGVDTNAMARELIGQRFVHAASHGKQMCFRFGETCWLGVHLGMTGKTHLQPAASSPGKHDHLVLRMSGGQALVFTDPRMFGRILYSHTSKTPSWWAMLPPEILSQAFTPDYMAAFLRRRKNSPLKAVLLMQETFPGVGNWMADESLWRAQINPHRKAGELRTDERERLYAELRYVCREALAIVGADWGDFPDDWLFNHRWKDGGLCPQTGQPLRREPIGGRTTCWSLAWQKEHGVWGGGGSLS